jgi:hypothetical protein
VDVSVLPLVSARPAPAVTVYAVGSGGVAGGGACAIAGAEHASAAQTRAWRIEGERGIDGYLLERDGKK